MWLFVRNRFDRALNSPQNVHRELHRFGGWAIPDASRVFHWRDIFSTLLQLKACD
jgi:hypothetical protein